MKKTLLLLLFAVSAISASADDLKQVTFPTVKDFDACYMATYSYMSGDSCVDGDYYICFYNGGNSPVAMLKMISQDYQHLVGTYNLDSLNYQKYEHFSAIAAIPVGTDTTTFFKGQIEIKWTQTVSNKPYYQFVGHIENDTQYADIDVTIPCYRAIDQYYYDNVGQSYTITLKDDPDAGGITPTGEEYEVSVGNLTFSDDRETKGYWGLHGLSQDQLWSVCVSPTESDVVAGTYDMSEMDYYSTWVCPYDTSSSYYGSKQYFSEGTFVVTYDNEVCKIEANVLTSAGVRYKLHLSSDDSAKVEQIFGKSEDGKPVTGKFLRDGRIVIDNGSRQFSVSGCQLK